jgi:hypothetical protein
MRLSAACVPTMCLPRSASSLQLPTLPCGRLSLDGHFLLKALVCFEPRWSSAGHSAQRQHSLSALVQLSSWSQLRNSAHPGARGPPNIQTWNPMLCAQHALTYRLLNCARFDQASTGEVTIDKGGHQ